MSEPAGSPPRAVTFLLGPTASGKSDVALALAALLRQRGGEPAILACDSQQVYRGADIGTSKPTRDDRARVAHGGLDLVEPGEPFDVGRYLRHAREFVESLSPEAHLIVVGGTGLYYRALTQGLADIPPIPPAVREEISALSLPEMSAELRRVDPEICLTLDLANPQRVARALEVYRATGRSLLAWHREAAPQALLPLGDRARAFLLLRAKADLHERIERRTKAMLRSGWIEEARALLDQHGAECLSRARFPAIGYAPLVDWLRNGGEIEAVAQQITLATRQYAKRQLTWFRREPNLALVKCGADLHSPPGDSSPSPVASAAPQHLAASLAVNASAEHIAQALAHTLTRPIAHSKAN